MTPVKGFWDLSQKRSISFVLQKAQTSFTMSFLFFRLWYFPNFLMRLLKAMSLKLLLTGIERGCTEDVKDENSCFPPVEPDQSFHEQSCI